MRKKPIFDEKRVRLHNLLYAVVLNVQLGKTQEERFRTIAKYQAQSNVKAKTC